MNFRCSEGAGETVMVTDRGWVVAEFVAAPVAADASGPEQRMGALTRLGLLTPAKVSPTARLPQRKPVAKLAEVMRDPPESRSER